MANRLVWIMVGLETACIFFLFVLLLTPKQIIEKMSGDYRLRIERIR